MSIIQEESKGQCKGTYGGLAKVSEKFRPIPGYEMYSVSDCGQVWSLYGNGRVLKQREDKDGYYLVNLHRNGKQKTFPVHKLVLMVFVSHCPDGMETRHLDGDNKNNCVENLCWGTPKENGQDQVLHGTTRSGERNVHAKLREVDVLKIRAMSGSQQAIADKFGVKPALISKIKLRRIWRHI